MQQDRPASPCSITGWLAAPPSGNSFPRCAKPFLMNSSTNICAALVALNSGKTWRSSEPDGSPGPSCRRIQIHVDRLRVMWFLLRCTEKIKDGTLGLPALLLAIQKRDIFAILKDIKQWGHPEHQELLE